LAETFENRKVKIVLEDSPIPFPNIAKIPDGLKHKKQWICWRYGGLELLMLLEEKRSLAKNKRSEG